MIELLCALYGGKQSQDVRSTNGLTAGALAAG